MKQKIAGWVGILALALGLALGGTVASQAVAAPSAQAWTIDAQKQKVVMIYSSKTGKWLKNEVWYFRYQNYTPWENFLYGDRARDGWYVQKRGHASYLAGFVWYGTYLTPYTIKYYTIGRG